MMSVLQMQDESDQAEAKTEMPLYQSHKKVRAFKIEKIIFDSDEATKENRETNGSAVLFGKGMYIRADSEYVDRHNPEVGGYYVVYESGYASWSPADAFEGGYTLCT